MRGNKTEISSENFIQTVHLYCILYIPIVWAITKPFSVHQIVIALLLSAAIRVFWNWDQLIEQTITSSTAKFELEQVLR